MPCFARHDLSAATRCGFCAPAFPADALVLVALELALLEEPHAATVSESRTASSAPAKA
jgi:hypothetical protein